MGPRIWKAWLVVTDSIDYHSTFPIYHAALFLAHRNIRVNSVHPGRVFCLVLPPVPLSPSNPYFPFKPNQPKPPSSFFPTDIHDYILANPNLSPDAIEKFKRRTGEGAPMMRGGEPIEIAQAILYLASTESSYT